MSFTNPAEFLRFSFVTVEFRHLLGLLRAYHSAMPVLITSILFYHICFYVIIEKQTGRMLFYFLPRMSRFLTNLKQYSGTFCGQPEAHDTCCYVFFSLISRVAVVSTTYCFNSCCSVEHPVCPAAHLPPTHFRPLGGVLSGRTLLHPVMSLECEISSYRAPLKDTITCVFYILVLCLVVTH